MAVPTPRSYQQIIGEMLDAFLSKTGLPRLKKGSAGLSILETAAQSDTRAAQDLYALLNATSLKRARGSALVQLGVDEGVTPLKESKATGVVTVTDSNYTKIVSTISQASPAPVVGTTTLDVTDATNFTATGSIYLGRGSANYEGPLAYSAKTDNGVNWSLTLSSPTTRFHNVNETVTLAQGGNRLIPQGAIVRTPQGNSRNAINFTTLYSATIPDGEVTIVGVPVVAQVPGTIGNIPAYAITSFASAPFAGATVTNPSPFTNAGRTETDPEYAERIALIKNTRQLATPLALTTLVIGATDALEQRRCTSATLVRGNPTTLYVDDGTAYEPTTSPIALESIYPSALGGEVAFKLTQHPVAKAHLISTLPAPFNCKLGDTLGFIVNGVTTTHIFMVENAKDLTNLTTYELAAAVNANPQLKWSARPINNAQQLSFYAKADTLNDITLAASTLDLGISATQASTLKLYKNDRLFTDYTLDRNTGEGILNNPLVVNDVLQAGTTQTRAFLESTILTPVTLSDDGVLWLAVDATNTPKDINVTTTTPLTVSIAANGIQPWGYRLTITATTGSFSNLAIGDQVVLYDPGFTTQAAYYISKVATDGSYINIDAVNVSLPRANHQATTLADGRILLTGGFVNYQLKAATTGAEMYDPGTSTYTPVTDSTYPRQAHTATLLPNGKVLVYGGSKTNDSADVVAAAEIYDPATDTWTLTSTTNQPVARYRHQAVLLGTKVYVVGGRIANGTDTTTTASYDYLTDVWTTLTALNTQRSSFTLNALTSTLLAVGGENGTTVLASAEEFDPAGPSWTNRGVIQTARQGHRSVILATGDVLTTGGSTTNTTTTATPSLLTDLYDHAAHTWANATPMNKARANFGCCILASGKVVAGFGDQAAGTPYAEIYDPAGPSWTNTAAPTGTFIRRYPTASYVATNKVLFVGGASTTATYAKVSASSEEYNSVANTWTGVDPTLGSVALTLGGLGGVRAASRLVKLTLVAGANYTASTVVSGLSDPLLPLGEKGISASVYRTNQVRLNTNSFDNEGSLLLVAANEDAQALGFTSGLRYDNLDTHLGAVSSISLKDRSLDVFDVSWVRGSGETPRGKVGSTYLNTLRPGSGSTLVVGHNPQDSATLTRFGHNLGFNSTITAQSYDGLAYGINNLTFRNAPDLKWLSDERAFWIPPFALGVSDSLVVVADNDPTSKQFNVNMYRKCKPTTNVYGATITLQDALPATPAPLAKAFGLDYDWSDFMVLVRSRGMTHDADSTRRAVWRWFAYGASRVKLSYEYPLAPSDPVSVYVDDLGAYTYASIRLAGGALKTGLVLPNGNYVGVASTSTSNGFGHIVYALGFSVATASRTSNVTTLTLTLPSTVTNHGLITGNVVYVKSTDPNFTTGAYSVTGATATTITYAEVAADQGATASIGTVSRGAGEASMASLSPSLAVGDFFRVGAGLGTTFLGALAGTTLRALTVGDQFIKADLPGYAGANSTTLTWYLVGDYTQWQVFANPGQSIATVVAAVNALAGDSLLSPITGVSTGTGAGTLTKSTAEDVGTYPSYVSLTDGVNYVRSQTNPVDVLSHYTLTLKDDVTATLATNADWANEIVYLVPIIPTSVATWLNTPAVTGLFTCAKTEVTTSSGLVCHTLTPGSEGSINVQGGSANAATAAIRGDVLNASGIGVARVLRTDLPGIPLGAWVSIDNTRSVNKGVFDAATELTSIGADGTFTFDSGGTKVWDNAANDADNAVVFIEKQGRFVCYNGVFDVSTLTEGDYVVVSLPAAPTAITQIAAANTGTFRVVRVAHTLLDGTSALWIENTSATDQIAAEADLKFVKAASVMPGDILTVSVPAWGNSGTWVVSDVGVGFTDYYTFKVVTTTKSPVAVSVGAALGADYPLVQVVSPTPYRAIKRVIGVSLDQASAAYARLKFDTSVGYAYLSESTGAIITVLDKLGFSTTLATGQDAYQYHTGLLQEVNKVVYGDVGDTATYPGVGAAGGKINIDSPLVRRVSFGLSIRLKTGVSALEIESTIKSAVAAVINSYPHGTPIPISLLIGAANEVVGVSSVTPISKYGVGSDLLAVQPYEKALVLDLATDLTITFVGA